MKDLIKILITKTDVSFVNLLSKNDFIKVNNIDASNEIEKNIKIVWQLRIYQKMLVS